MKKTVLIYSGGVDSTALLYFLLSQRHKVKALGINYGQRHLKEIDAAREICASLRIDFRVADLSSLKPLLAGSALTSEEITVPEGHYTSESMKATVVPNRNMLLLAVAIAWAITTRYDSVAYAAHAGDHAIYPDCRPEFVRALEKAARLCHYDPIEILTPFMHKTKAEIVRIGGELQVPFHLTWSCYVGEQIHCGKCGTCTERAEAFMLAHVPDPTQYASTPQISYRSPA